MYNTVNLFQTAGAKAQHAALRQSTIAQNIANADTPGYAAQDVAPFGDTYNAMESGLRATRPGHLHGDPTQPRSETRKSGGAEASPNGNSVSLEQEMVKAVQTERAHDQALAVYRHAMTVLRASLGR